jgi:dihydroflavonol-4-reductase
MSSTILVTGIGGFIGGHCAVALLRKGYYVRGAVRNIQRGKNIAEMLARYADVEGRIDFVEVDLEHQKNWDEAVKSCDGVIHVASPIPSVQPKHADELIVPARDGVLRVLRAAQEAGVKRVVMTSSIGAICYGHSQAKVFTEADWTNLEASNLIPYLQSKTIAERAAWDFIADAGASLDLVSINPGHVVGPVLSTDLSPSVAFILNVLQGHDEGWPNLGFNMVDVRDVARAHVAALEIPSAGGNRIALVTDHLWLAEVAVILKEHYGRRFSISTRQLSDDEAKHRAANEPQLHDLLPYLGLRQDFCNDRLRTLLSVNPISARAAIIASADSFIALGLVK